MGASGLLAIGEQSVGLIELQLDAGHAVRALDLIEVEPLSGEAVARRVVPDSLDVE